MAPLVLTLVLTLVLALVLAPAPALAPRQTSPHQRRTWAIPTWQTRAPAMAAWAHRRRHPTPTANCRNPPAPCRGAAPRAAARGSGRAIPFGTGPPLSPSPSSAESSLHTTRALRTRARGGCKAIDRT